MQMNQTGLSAIQNCREKWKLLVAYPVLISLLLPMGGDFGGFWWGGGGGCGARQEYSNLTETMAKNHRFQRSRCKPIYHLSIQLSSLKAISTWPASNPVSLLYCDSMLHNNNCLLFRKSMRTSPCTMHI